MEGSKAIRYGEYMPLEDDEVVGFIRKYEDKYALVFINNTDKMIDKIFILPEDAGIKDGITLKDKLSV